MRCVVDLFPFPPSIFKCFAVRNSQSDPLSFWAVAISVTCLLQLQYKCAIQENVGPFYPTQLLHLPVSTDPACLVVLGSYAATFNVWSHFISIQSIMISVILNVYSHFLHEVNVFLNEHTDCNYTVKTTWVVLTKGGIVSLKLGETEEKADRSTFRHKSWQHEGLLWWTSPGYFQLWLGLLTNSITRDALVQPNTDR